MLGQAGLWLMKLIPGCDDVVVAFWEFIGVFMGDKTGIGKSCSGEFDVIWMVDFLPFIQGSVTNDCVMIR